MPELKHNFQGGKMEKDLDERIIPNGQYREALNIEVATSEDSDVGAAQNIIGNIKRTSAISGPGNKYVQYNNHITHVIDPENDNVYRFVNTEDDGHGIWMDRIVEYNTVDQGALFEKAVVVDIYKVRTVLSGVYRGPCDIDAYLDFSNNTYQIRWGMQLIIPGFITKDDNIYIKHVERLNSNMIRARLNVNELTALDGAGFDFGVQMGNSEIYLEGDRNLNFSVDRKITGLNIIDGMLFWTDNYSEPKKVNIERAKQGSTAQTWDTWRDTSLVNGFGFDIGDFDQHTRLVVNDINPIDTIKNNSSCITVGPGGSTQGCTDGTATNYDPAASIDDGSCTYIFNGICGCTISSFLVGGWDDPVYTVDPTAYVPDNYDSSATVDDGSCYKTGLNTFLKIPFDGLDLYTSTTVYTEYQSGGDAMASAEMTTLGGINIWLVDTTPLLPITIDATNCPPPPPPPIEAVYGCMDNGLCTVSTCGYDSPNPSTPAVNYDCASGNTNYQMGYVGNQTYTGCGDGVTDDDGSCMYP